MTQAAVFPGQGAQYVGMGAPLWERYPLARELLDEAESVLGFAIGRVMAEGPEQELTRTDLSQPAILLHSWMAWRVLCAERGEPAIALCGGLSLGEYSALLLAGACDFPTALRLVRLRGQAMQEAADARSGGMLALIGADEAAAQALCDAVRADEEVLQIANLNSAGQVVIAGDRDACERATSLARDHGIRRAVPLPVAGAFHSPHMAPAADRLRAALSDSQLQDPRIPVYSNVTAAPVHSAAEIPDLLVKQLTHPVRWAASLQAMHSAGAEAFLELGPGKTISGMIARTLDGVTSTHIDGPDDLD